MIVLRSSKFSKCISSVSTWVFPKKQNMFLQVFLLYASNTERLPYVDFWSLVLEFEFCYFSCRNSAIFFPYQTRFLAVIYQIIFVQYVYLRIKDAECSSGAPTERNRLWIRAVVIDKRHLPQTEKQNSRFVRCRGLYNVCSLALGS